LSKADEAPQQLEERKNPRQRGNGPDLAGHGSQEPEPATALGRKKLSVASVALLLFAVGAAAIGQVMLKHGMEIAKKHAESRNGSLAVSAATSPWVLFGLCVFAISALAWLTTLSRLPLSIAYPFNALGYLGILTASVLVLHERANVWTWFGTAFVVAGLIIVVATKPG
jgi:drug/metabolite transporter (DMT)-like permease